MRISRSWILPSLLIGAGAVAGAQDTLASGASLAKGQSLTSRNGAYRLDVRDDGKVAVYRLAPAAVLQWESPGEGFEGAGALTMREDGNLVLTDADGATRWHTATAGPLARLVLEDDGALCVRSGTGSLWMAGAVTVRIVLPLAELRKAIQDEDAVRGTCVIL
ncbi:hypothetical protein [Geothrix sp. 21YS21S-2]|uniref:hypothetical protein n=1 Tax=Geothrix sp. 21YS21S-2 TaxID=3068893 RepID=UPI0027B9A90F|nr:hypothetical protein [Geothrix sp. 21YS21S-2]